MSDSQPEAEPPAPPAAEPTGDAAPKESGPSSRKRRRRLRKRSVVQPVGLRRVFRSDGLLVLVLLGSVLPLGAVHVPVLLVVSIFAILSAVHALLGRGRTIASLPGVFVVLAGLALYTALQATPIPFALLSHLSPLAADIWGRALEPLGQAAPRTASLSLDPGASWVEALKWWTYAAVFISAGTFGLRYGEKWGATLVFGVALVVALSTMGHGLVNAHKVFGIYTPSMGGRGWRIGPFVNANALAGYLNLGLLTGVGLIASSAPPLPRWALALAVAMMLGVSATTGSRGGLASLVLGLILLLPMLNRARSVEGVHSKADRYYTLGALALALMGGALFAVIAATGKTTHLLADPSVKKLRMIRWAPAMIHDYPWFGAGRGSFEGVFPAYKMGDSNSVYGYAENFVVQWMTEWGCPVALLVIAVLAWLLRPASWGAGRTTAGSGLFAGFVALAVQNIVDLGLEIPGVAVLACASVGVAWGGRAGPLQGGETGSFPTRTLSAVIGLAGIALFVPAALKGTQTLKLDKELVHETFPEPPFAADAVATFKENLADAISRHPAEAYFPRQGALLSMVSRSDNPVPWVQRALERSGGSGRTHYLLAVLLGRHGIRTQALLELRYAAERDEDLTTRAARMALRMTRDHEELVRVVPGGPNGAIMLSALAEILRRVDADMSYRFFEEAIDRNPNSLGARIAITNMLLDALEHRVFGSRCAEERRVVCQKAVLEQIRALAQARPDDDTALELVGKLLLVADRPVQAASLLSSLCPTLPNRSKCVWVWMEAAAQAGDLEQFSRVIKFVELDACENPRSCGKTYTRIGDVVSHTSGPFAALPYYRRAVTEEPSRGAWMRVARVAALIGAHGEATRALEHAAAYGAPSQDLQDSLEKERRKAMLETLKVH